MKAPGCDIIVKLLTNNQIPPLSHSKTPGKTGNRSDDNLVHNRPFYNHFKVKAKWLNMKINSEI